MRATVGFGTAEVGLALSPLIGAVKTRTGAEVMLSATMTGGLEDRKALRRSHSSGRRPRQRLVCPHPRYRPAPARPGRRRPHRRRHRRRHPGCRRGSWMFDFEVPDDRRASSPSRTSAPRKWRYKRQIWQLLSIALGCGLVCFSVLAIAMRAFVDRPLAGLADRLEGLAQGQPASAAPGRWRGGH